MGILFYLRMENKFNRTINFHNKNLNKSTTNLNNSKKSFLVQNKDIAKW